MKYRNILLVCIPLLALPLLLANLTLEKDAEIQRFHSDAEMAHFQLMLGDTSLPKGYNYLFAGSGVCQKCHGFDTLGIASVDQNGNDVNVTDDWRATMMANSARDPFWRAKVSHEVLLYPQHKAEIEDKCTSCHAPMGHFDAKHLGALHYGIADMVTDTLALDGVSCLACHMMEQDLMGTSFSGQLTFDTFKVAYGPYTSPLVSPMLTETGYKPKFSEKMGKGEACAGCHTLITETFDYAGTPTGDKFVEQATYHEWVNSAYRDSISCQGCHMPSLDKWPVRLVTGANTEPRSPYYLHELVGGNVTMLGLFRDNVDALGLTAGPSQFQDVLLKTKDMLQNKTLLLDIGLIDRTLDTAKIAVKLTNLAGHKFPSGYPSRRAFIQFVVQTESGDTVFVSGKMDENYEVIGQNDTYEPHYQVITDEEQVQIYELVLGDVNGDVTTVLVRAKDPIKDNRIPPLGFTTSHSAYDTTLIAGVDASDLSFNRDGALEGTGSDVVHYYIPMNGVWEQLQVTANVYYQPLPPKWMDEMFSVMTPEIETFRTMFDAADRAPVLVRSVQMTVDALPSSTKQQPKAPFVKLYPTLSSNGRLFVESSKIHEVQVFDLNGRPVEQLPRKSGNYELWLREKGVYLVRFRSVDGQVQVERVVVQ
ncbi:MAG: T9SS type A sorting domain-containing protein [Saprospiraceae bacterium]|nr:T9SS type A sorting domain-containing protein [Saprospiraceae bacterium]